ncbi:MAG: prepilin peptidase [Betaproteobacteria bacterium]|nr:prepilin peptidase [Betaproteobacteria bacterium]
MLNVLSDPVWFVSVATIAGLCIGSFLNVVIHRLPKMMERECRAQCEELSGALPKPAASAAERYNLMVPRSRCPACNHGITAFENVPLLSFAILRGKCSACGARIGLRYPVIELCGGALAGYCAARYGLAPAALGAMLFGWSMLALAAIDADTQLLPDDITLPLLWVGLLFNLYGIFAPLPSALIGAVAGYLALWSVYWLFKIATGKEGMGYGDFKLLAAIGAWLGWQALPLVILLSSAVAAVVGILLMSVARRARDHPIPFGPYLAAAGVIAMFWGPQITQWYLPLLR